VVEKAYELALHFTQHTSRQTLKTKGQFFTPAAIARFMAALLGEAQREDVAILDPGAGTGILSAAAVEHLATDPVCLRIHVDAYETCVELLPTLHATLDACHTAAAQAGKVLTYAIHAEDFVAACAHRMSGDLLRPADPEAWRPYDFAISNPPYGKLRKDDPRSILTSRIVCGQPNIYALFMALAANMLVPQGKLAFIVPRSFTSGAYFRAFRREFLSKVRPLRIHVFESRRRPFRSQDVLQENLILVGERLAPDARAARQPTVIVSNSKGAEDLSSATSRVLPLSSVVQTPRRHHTLSIPASARDDGAVEFVRRWTHNLASLGLRVSTGPVVAFRTTEFHRMRPGRNTVPFLWLQHVLPMRVTWPIPGLSKPQYFDGAAKAQGLVVKAPNIVLLRRFSAKEQPRRLTAAALLHIARRGVALENHLNYITALSDAMSPEDAAGIAAALNLSVVDRFFRVCNGNTQVGAAEIRDMPFPSLEQIRTVGRQVLAAGNAAHYEAVAAEVLGVPAQLHDPFQ
jgi:adenine-specific DNA-methyltransferase